MSTKPTDDRTSSSKISTPDANNATYFLPGDCSWNPPYWQSKSDFRKNNKRSFFKHLKEVNEGKKNGEKWQNTKLHTSTDNRHLIETITTHLELTANQRSNAESLFHAFNLRKWGIRKAVVAYALCAYVVKNDERNEYRRTHPHAPESDKDRLFVEMADSLGITDRAFLKTYGKVESKVREYSVPPKPDWPDGAGLEGGGT
jgi:hypothetical protein